MEKPFRLEEGIYFEDSKQMLVWGESFEELHKIDNPEISENGDTLKWYGKLCLDGQKLNVIVYKNQYTNKKGILELINFEEEKENQLTIYKTAEKYSAFFEKYFGEPSQTKTIYGRTTELWNISDLQIILGIGERFSDFLIFGMHYGENFY
ncbi:hypothetical protein [Flavobacterium restrictum]|uniref:Uncharacterized protein n=1 Tax=Flavobacterium restrictum TaxID=2594428 RepID=A0A553E8F5_9FLAO|nr:hypothetical protein [Flavobacterium restrictum]TRX41317.1 hypothetical protein FNW21_04250 [Flavobacterium restrictum]